MKNSQLLLVLASITIGSTVFATTAVMSPMDIEKLQNIQNIFPQLSNNTTSEEEEFNTFLNEFNSSYNQLSPVHKQKFLVNFQNLQTEAEKQTTEDLKEELPLNHQ